MSLDWARMEVQNGDARGRKAAETHQRSLVRVKGVVFIGSDLFTFFFPVPCSRQVAATNTATIRLSIRNTPHRPPAQTRSSQARELRRCARLRLCLRQENKHSSLSVRPTCRCDAGQAKCPVAPRAASPSA